ncbi:hypothetical protein [Rossellomorea vietnamensis]|nr:hypothetical protein [Rossellomorea vietnamensis]
MKRKSLSHIYFNMKEAEGRFLCFLVIDYDNRKQENRPHASYPATSPN